MLTTHRKQNNTYIVAQMGARMQYAVPRILHQSGQLERLYTDLCASSGWSRLIQSMPDSMLPGTMKRLAGRVPQGVPGSHIKAFTQFGFKYALRRAVARAPADSTAAHLWASETFSKLVVKQGFGKAGGVYTFNTAGLELLRIARERGLQTVMEQTMAPREFADQILQEEQDCHPIWRAAYTNGSLADKLAAREREEWEEADIILCGSEFVRSRVAALGGPFERCVVVPYGIDLPTLGPKRRRVANLIRVLTVGEVGLRKGTPYLLEAARHLRKGFEFRMIGKCAVPGSVRNTLPSHVCLSGGVPHSEIATHYAWADVFVLPSLCEGSATVAYEALAAGLPVICTPNTGAVVEDGVDGFIVPIRDSSAIVARLECLLDDRDLLNWMSENARRKAEMYTLEKYGERLSSVFGKRVS